MNQRRRLGFTLIEVLIVGAISAILVSGLAIAIVNFASSAIETSAIITVREEITKSVNFIANELKEARYIYRQGVVGGCASTSGNGIGAYCPARMGTDGTITDDGGLTGTFSRANLSGGTANSTIQLAFWVRATASGLTACSNAAPSSPKPDGALLSVPNALIASSFALSPNDADIPAVLTTPCNLVLYGTPNSTPAYSLVVYFVRAANTYTANTWDGPLVLNRWQSPVVPIAFSSFGFNGGQASKIPAGSFVLNPPTPNNVGSGDVIADFLDNIPATGFGPITVVNSANNAQTVDVSIEGGLYNSSTTAGYPGSDITRAANYINNTNPGKLVIEENRLFYRTTVVARNACGGINACPLDPNN